ncbi:Uncharacterized protein Rs2_29804 [Raphanus sativus]|nr:Uncharacterized protein Rs2_29804 [Raphanus sativus]
MKRVKQSRSAHNSEREEMSIGEVRSSRRAGVNRDDILKIVFVRPFNTDNHSRLLLEAASLIPKASLKVAKHASQLEQYRSEQMRLNADFSTETIVLDCSLLPQSFLSFLTAQLLSFQGSAVSPKLISHHLSVFTSI